LASPRNEITRILQEIDRGQRDAEALLPLVYDELRAQAERYMRQERRDHTLQPTALVNEAYVRLVGGEQATWQNRQHFYAVAATAMRRILVDHARRRRAGKRGGDQQPLSLADADHPTRAPDVNLLALDQALSKLARFDPRRSRIVELRFFGGLSTDEVARILDVTPRTVERQWSLARAWLYDELGAK